MISVFKVNGRIFLCKYSKRLSNAFDQYNPEGVPQFDHQFLHKAV